mmetsp:Transcript_145197/g.251424  ORF Transcript_145197/g.251424 Transcript_145197/m.251424 type:complete len:349 (-) Transcript_145197:293-1339(-)
MDKVILTLTCLACAGHGRRVQVPIEQLQSLLFQEAQEVAAFNPSFPRTHLHLEHPGFTSSQPLRPGASARMDGTAPAPSTTIRIRKKGDKGSSGSHTGDGAPAAASTTITVRKKKSEGDSGSTKISAKPAKSDDDTMTTVVKVKKPSGASVSVAPAPTPSSEDPMAGLSDAEQRLLEGSQRGNCTLILEALREEANPNILDPNGRTPLHFVAGLGVAPAVVLLIHFGAQVDIPDEQGLTPLHMAAGYANKQTLKVLIGAGANPDVVSPTGGTPLQIIVSRGEFQLKQFMNRTGIQKFNPKKKDDKLEELKACLDIFDNVEKIKEEMNWDEMLGEVLTFCALQKEKIDK